MAPTTISLYPATTTVKHSYVKPDLRINTSMKSNGFPPRSSSLTATVGKVMNGAAIRVTCQSGTPDAGRTASVNYSRSSLPPPPPRTSHALSDHDGPRPAREDMIAASSAAVVSEPQRKNSNRSATSTGSLRRRNANRRSSGGPPSRAGSPTPILSTIDASREQQPIDEIPMRSIFPMYQPELPLSKQPYYPQHGGTPQLPPQQFSKGVDSASSFAIPIESISDNLTTAYEDDVSWANESDLSTLWGMANGERFVQCRTNRLCFVVARDHSQATSSSKSSTTTINIGSVSGTTLYSASIPDTRSGQSTTMKVQRIHPRERGTFPVADMTFSSLASEDVADDHTTEPAHVTSIFPQIAALSAIRGVANSLQAREIARFDPNASSVEAAQLAMDAVGMAKEREDSILTFKRADCSFELHHPEVGRMTVIVTPVIETSNSSSMTGRVSIHLPGSQSRDHASALATLDLTNGYLELDAGTLYTSRSPYMIDTVICALLSSAVHSSKQSMQTSGLTHFAAPPKTPTPVSKRAFRTPTILSRSSSINSFETKISARSSRREPKAKTKEKKREENHSRLPPITRGILHLLGFTFDAIVWLLSLGVKILTKLVVCLSGEVEKT